MRFLTLILASAMLLFAGCATVKFTPPLVQAENTTLVNDSLAILTEQFPPASSKVFFPDVERGKNPLLDQLADDMRAKGYAIGETKGALMCAIVAFPLDEEGALLLRIDLGDDFSAFRRYRREAGQVIPETGFTLRKGDTTHE